MYPVRQMCCCFLSSLCTLANPHSTAVNRFCLLSDLHRHTRSISLTITKISEKLPQQMLQGKLASSAARNPVSHHVHVQHGHCEQDHLPLPYHPFHAVLSRGLAFPHLSQQLMFNQKPLKLKIILYEKRKNTILKWYLLKKWFSKSTALDPESTMKSSRICILIKINNANVLKTEVVFVTCNTSSWVLTWEVYISLVICPHLHWGPYPYGMPGRMCPD